MSADDAFDRWVTALEERHLATLTFPELSRALRALSSTYVQRRGQIGRGAALAGAGKRAAFALFYGPIHYLLVREIVLALPGATAPATTLVDLGCGTGASGAAWAGACASATTAAGITGPRVVGIDRHPWALEQAKWTYASFGLPASTRQGDLSVAAFPKPPALVLAAFAVNELPDARRDAMLERLLDRGANGDRVLVVEPIAGFVARWWGRSRDAFVARGGRADEWRFRLELPPIVAKLDRAAGLDHRELTGRSLWLGPIMKQ